MFVPKNGIYVVNFSVYMQWQHQGGCFSCSCGKKKSLNKNFQKICCIHNANSTSTVLHRQSLHLVP